jgi:hypothetical protein
VVNAPILPLDDLAHVHGRKSGWSGKLPPMHPGRSVGDVAATRIERAGTLVAVHGDACRSGEPPRASNR